jgi:L-seryl-tRNA(Ser) seleniumtransferase
LRFLTRPPAEIEAQAQRLLPAVETALRGKASVEIISVKSQIGSGSLPVDLVESHGIAVAAPGKRRNALAAEIAAAFRALPVPVIGRINDGAFIMDLRCLEREDEFLAQLPHLKIETP